MLFSLHSIFSVYWYDGGVIHGVMIFLRSHDAIIVYDAARPTIPIGLPIVALFAYGMVQYHTIRVNQSRIVGRSSPESFRIQHEWRERRSEQRK